MGATLGGDSGITVTYPSPATLTFSGSGTVASYWLNVLPTIYLPICSTETLVYVEWYYTPDITLSHEDPTSHEPHFDLLRGDVDMFWSVRVRSDRLYVRPRECC
eukprot:PhM_4_TR8887/c0_g1_i2/m.14157